MAKLLSTSAWSASGRGSPTPHLTGEGQGARQPAVHAAGAGKKRVAGWWTSGSGDLYVLEAQQSTIC